MEQANALPPPEMQRRDPPAAQPAAPSVVAPGNHDGVHRGHRALVDTARRLALRESPQLRVAALTFDPHPLHFVAPDRAPPLLTTPARRAQLLHGAGADYVRVRPFDAAFATLSPEAFIDEVLIAELGARAVVVGTDFRFGAQRAGDVELLHTLGAARGLLVVTVSPVTLDGQLVSSSQVRAALTRGDVELAARMLTRVHDVTRRVVHGDGRGRTIQFPTANLELEGLMPPADGVYAVSVRILDGDEDACEAGPPAAQGRLVGVANLGVRPTLGAGRSMEVHLLDFSGDLYGRSLRVGFVARLRGEQRFAGIDELRAQIARDVEAGRRAVATCEPGLLAWI
jgi:riboflavin kinase/FMN adenylyltransferase